MSVTSPSAPTPSSTKRGSHRDVQGTTDGNKMVVPSYRGRTLSSDYRNTSNAHKLLQKYMFGANNDKEKNQKAEELIKDLVKVLRSKELPLDKIAPEKDKGVKDETIKFVIQESVSVAYNKLKLPEQCPFDFNHLFNAGELEPNETLKGRLSKLLKSPTYHENKDVLKMLGVEKMPDTLSDKHLETVLEKTGLEQYFREDHAAYADEGKKRLEGGGILGLKLSDAKADRESVLKLQAGQMAAHILDEKKIYTEMTINENGSVTLAEKNGQTSNNPYVIKSYSEHMSAEGQKEHDALKSSYDDIQKKQEKAKEKSNKGGIIAGFVSAVGGVVDKGAENFSAAAKEVVGNNTVSQIADKLGIKIDDAVNTADKIDGTLKETTKVAEEVGNKARGIGFTVGMALCGAAALFAAPAIASSFGIAAGATVLGGGLTALGMMGASFFKDNFGAKEKQDSFKPKDDVKNTSDADGKDGAAAGEPAGEAAAPARTGELATGEPETAAAAPAVETAGAAVETAAPAPAAAAPAAAAAVETAGAATGEPAAAAAETAKKAAKKAAASRKDDASQGWGVGSAASAISGAVASMAGTGIHAAGTVASAATAPVRALRLGLGLTENDPEMILEGDTVADKRSKAADAAEKRKAAGEPEVVEVAEKEEADKRRGLEGAEDKRSKAANAAEKRKAANAAEKRKAAPAPAATTSAPAATTSAPAAGEPIAAAPTGGAVEEIPLPKMTWRDFWDIATLGASGALLGPNE